MARLLNVRANLFPKAAQLSGATNQQVITASRLAARALNASHQPLTHAANGVVDLVGEDFVLDFKSDRAIHPEHHQFQLWAYSQATAKPNAHIAYLRHDRLHTFTAAHLSELAASASTLVNGLVKGDFTPTPSETSCGICP
jgi:hypothetical protein